MLLGFRQIFFIHLLKLTLSWACGERYFLPSKLAGAISWAHGKVYIFIFLILFML